MLRMLRNAACLLTFLFPIGQAMAAAEYKIMTASERGTYIQIGRDLAKFIAPAADIALDVLPSAGSAENVHRLRYEPGVKFALVQSDVYQAFINQGAAGNAEAAAIIKPLRLVLPLYNEEIYFIARSDSPLNYVHEIKDAKVNVGPLQSGTAMSATTIYRMMFNQSMPDDGTSFLSNEDALIKLLKIDPNHPATKAALKTYFASTVRVANYPNLITEDVPGFAVKAFLVTYDYSLPVTLTYLGRFAKSLCQNFATLQKEGHPKWKEVELAMPEVGKGWIYSPPTARELKRCAQAAAKAAPVRPRACSTEQKILGLCE
jgi:uncharacterized protein